MLSRGLLIGVAVALLVDCGGSDNRSVATRMPTPTQTPFFPCSRGCCADDECNPPRQCVEGVCVLGVETHTPTPTATLVDLCSYDAACLTPAPVPSVLPTFQLTFVPLRPTPTPTQFELVVPTQMPVPLCYFVGRGLTPTVICPTPRPTA